MRDENKRENIRVEIERAQNAIESADLLFMNGYYNDAVSRLYYFVLYHVRALLFSKGFEPKTHEGALKLMSLHFVKTGELEPRYLHIFSRLMKYRGEADYNPSYVFTSEDYEEFRRDAVSLAEKIKNFLKEKGYLE